MYNKIAQKIDDAGDYDGMYYYYVWNAVSYVASFSDGSFGPVLLRLAWHGAGTYDKESKTGGRYEPTHYLNSLASDFRK